MSFVSKYLGDKPFWQVTARLALPIAIQNVLTSSFQLVDTMMVSRLGDVSLSAVGMAGQWGWLVALLGFGLCSGMSVFVSQYWGVRDLKGIRRVLGIALITGLLLSLGFMAVALIAPAWVIRFFNQDASVVETGCKYLVIACFSYPAVALTNIMATVLRNTERVTLPMYVSGITTVANALVNYALIFGKFGMPELGGRRCHRYLRVGLARTHPPAALLLEAEKPPGRPSEGAAGLRLALPGRLLPPRPAGGLQRGHLGQRHSGPQYDLFQPGL